MYLTAMPGGTPGPRKDYSCDANSGSANLCPEIDVMEANARATQSSLHKCQRRPRPGGGYTNCDQGGQISKPAAVGLFDTSGSIIDATRGFDVSVAFRVGAAAAAGGEATARGRPDGAGAGEAGAEARATLAGVDVMFSQEGRNLTLVPSRDAAYLQSMTEAVGQGLVAQMSLVKTHVMSSLFRHLFSSVSERSY